MHPGTDQGHPENTDIVNENHLHLSAGSSVATADGIGEFPQTVLPSSLVVICFREWKTLNVGKGMAGNNSPFISDDRLQSRCARGGRVLHYFTNFCAMKRDQSHVSNAPLLHDVATWIVLSEKRPSSSSHARDTVRHSRDRQTRKSFERPHLCT